MLPLGCQFTCPLFLLSHFFPPATDAVRSFHPPEPPSEKCLNNGNLSNVYFEMQPPSLSPILRDRVFLFISQVHPCITRHADNLRRWFKVPHCSHFSTGDLCNTLQLRNSCSYSIGINLRNSPVLPFLGLFFWSYPILCLLRYEIRSIPRTVCLVDRLLFHITQFFYDIISKLGCNLVYKD